MVKSIIANYTKEEIKAIMEKTSSFSEFMRQLGYSNYQGNSRNTVRRAIEKYGLQEEFEALKERSTKQASEKIKQVIANNTLDIKEVLKENSPFDRHTLKKIILRNNLLEYKCSKCGNTGSWEGEPLTLQLHHKNGNSKDNRLENLCWLCPNCHTQTENFGSKNSSVLRELEVKRQVEKQKREVAKRNFIDERKKYLDTIDTTKFGWQTKAGKDLGISHTQVKRWVSKYYPELLNKQ